jgi:hypothetical protein
MTDDPSAYRGFKSLNHKKGYAIGQPMTYWGVSFGVKPNRTFISSYAVPIAGTAGQPTVTTSLSQNDAIREMILGNLNDGTLAPVFIKELPEITSTWSTLKEKGFGAKKFANKFLAYKFGILPFLGDLKKLAKGHQAIRQHTKFINDNYSKTIKVSKSNGSVSGTVAYTKPTGIYTAESLRADWSGTSRAFCTLKVVRRYTSQDIINQTLDYYGASISNILWEVTPYSFVVDWFVDIGGLINHLSPKFQKPCCQLLDGGSVLRGSVSIPYFVWDRREEKAIAYMDQLTKVCIRSSSPILSSSLLGSGLDWAKTGVASALLIQKIG